MQTPRLWKDRAWVAGSDNPAEQFLNSWPSRRAALIQLLSSADRPQLVIVRYPSPDWQIGEEWVFNSAEIEQQRVVFAHDLGIEEDEALLRYFTDRAALLLTFDRDSGREHIEPYPSSTKPE
jgi:hypothetical protein